MGIIYGERSTIFFQIYWTFQGNLKDMTRASLMSLETVFHLYTCIPELLNINEPKHLNANISQKFLYVMVRISNHKLSTSNKKLHFIPLFFALILCSLIANSNKFITSVPCNFFPQFWECKTFLFSKFNKCFFCS